MKLKARDIISGWPRGRSTGCFTDCRDDLFFYRMRWTNPRCPEIPLLLSDLEANIAYHETQQAMVTAYLERWRLPPLDARMRPLPPDEIRALEQLRLRPLVGV